MGRWGYFAIKHTVKFSWHNHGLSTSILLVVTVEGASYIPYAKRKKTVKIPKLKIWHVFWLGIGRESFITSNAQLENQSVSTPGWFPVQCYILLDQQTTAWTQLSTLPMVADLLFGLTDSMPIPMNIKFLYNICHIAILI